MALVAYGSSSDENESEEDDVLCDEGNVIKNSVIKPVNNNSSTSKSRNSKTIAEVNGLNDIGKNFDKDVVKNGSNNINFNANISDDEDELLLKKNISDDDEPKNIVSVFSLPAPKTKLHDIDFDWNQLTKVSRGTTQPIKISIPSLAELTNEESSEPVKKKLKPSKTGSGLFALLPSPKNSFMNPVKSTLKPQQLKAKVVTKPLIKKEVVSEDKTQRSIKLCAINYEDLGDEDDDKEIDEKKVDFFSLSSTCDIPSTEAIRIPEIDSSEIIKKPEPEMVGQLPNILQNEWTERNEVDKSMGFINSNNIINDNELSASSSSLSYIPFNQEDIQLDGKALQQLCGRRERQKGATDVQIIDISGDAILPDPREWLTKQLTEEQEKPQSHKRKDGPTSQQRRKHQITYLAFQAKEHELELKNQWANNRMSRKQTQAKYGF